ncbi:MAG: hypothetical protein HRT99_03645 [Mycoplasmatales bacterium]|nr:hypothetical protein [Mycoplasmatales bacterium]
MKSRLITNGILNIIISTIIFIGIIIDFVGEPKGFRVVFQFILSSIYIASLIMGIVTLAMKRHPSAKGLTISSGILAILGFIPVSCAVVSFIGVHKINSSEVEQ